MKNLVLEWIRTRQILIIFLLLSSSPSSSSSLLLVLVLQLVLLSTFNLLYLTRNCHAKTTGLPLGGQLS